MAYRFLTRTCYGMRIVTTVLLAILWCIDLSYTCYGMRIITTVCIISSTMVYRFIIYVLRYAYHNCCVISNTMVYRFIIYVLRYAYHNYSMCYKQYYIIAYRFIRYVLRYAYHNCCVISNTIAYRFLTRTCYGMRIITTVLLAILYYGVSIYHIRATVCVS